MRLGGRCANAGSAPDSPSRTRRCSVRRLCSSRSYDAPFTAGGAGLNGFYIYTGERSEWNGGSTDRWFIDVERPRMAAAGTLITALRATSGNGVSVPWLDRRRPRADLEFLDAWHRSCIKSRLAVGRRRVLVARLLSIRPSLLCRPQVVQRRSNQIQVGARSAIGMGYSTDRNAQAPRKSRNSRKAVAFSACGSSPANTLLGKSAEERPQPPRRQEFLPTARSAAC